MLTDEQVKGNLHTAERQMLYNIWQELVKLNAALVKPPKVEKPKTDKPPAKRLTTRGRKNGRNDADQGTL